MKRGGREFPVADMSMFDTIPHKSVVPARADESELTVSVQEILSTLPEHLQMIYYFRYVEQMPIRKIASTMGYESHSVIQYHLKQLEDMVRGALEKGSEPTT